MADLHIEDFHKDVARILSRLYAAFPRPVQLYVEDLCGPDTPDEYGIQSPRHQACFATMLWLAEEGYLRYVDHIRQQALDQAVLTRKAFLLLSGLSTEPGDAAPISRIDRMRRALASSSGELADLVRSLLS